MLDADRRPDETPPATGGRAAGRARPAGKRPAGATAGTRPAPDPGHEAGATPGTTPARDRGTRPARDPGHQAGTRPRAPGRRATAGTCATRGHEAGTHGPRARDGQVPDG